VADQRWTDVLAAASELVGQHLELVGPTERGESRSTMRVRSGDHELILKITSEGSAGLDDQRRLVRLANDLRERGYPAPEHLGAGRAGPIVFTVQRAIRGTTFEPGPGVLPDRALIDQLLPRVLDAVALQRDAGDLADPPWPGWLLDTIEHGGDGYCLHETMRERADTRKLLERLLPLARSNATERARSRDIVHFDLSPANILHVDGELTGIVDWNVPFTGAAQGDRGFDLATLLFYLYDDEPARRQLHDAAIEVSGRRWLVVYLCHLVLRQVEWSVRHRPGSDEAARFLHIAHDVLDDCERSDG
jgi:aminoglycoside phosphotransferase (APT) family kinase protein